MGELAERNLALVTEGRCLNDKVSVKRGKKI